jgi:hypothetical protein
MVEPVSMLLGPLVAEFGKGTVEAFFEHLQSRPAAPVVARPEPVSIIDLTRDQPLAVRATVALTARTAQGQPPPYWVMFGIHSAEGRSRVTPVIYGEPVELRVTAGEYDLSALFLTRRASFSDKSLLVAMAVTHEVLASRRVQQVAVSGLPPTLEQLVQLWDQRPAEELPFQLPVSLARLMLYQHSSVCHARDVSGLHCGRPAIKSLCAEHTAMVLRGEYVVWHVNGQRVHLS